MPTPKVCSTILILRQYYKRKKTQPPRFCHPSIHQCLLLIFQAHAFSFLPRQPIFFSLLIHSLSTCFNPRITFPRKPLVTAMKIMLCFNSARNMDAFYHSHATIKIICCCKVFPQSLWLLNGDEPVYNQTSYFPPPTHEASVEHTSSYH